MTYIGMIVLIVVILTASLRVLWKTQSQKTQYLTVENMAVLFLTYVILLIGFGLIYLLLELIGYAVLIDSTLTEETTFWAMLSSKLYFSAVTLLSVGYGDLTPVGIGRTIAVIEALVGYVLPAAFVVRSVIDIEAPKG